MTSPDPSLPPSHRKLLVAIAILAGLSSGLAAVIVAGALHATPLQIVQWGAGTFVTVTLLVLTINHELR
ncbi:hypothetical protein [Streptomyces sp. NBC_00299]|uniref:hypothetical protein n=1 Tax=Streptomyces sp. NBC_00299 TaxID=2975705 RepID=UPI002E2B737A|nr:hypothetical protein [Streptomyces sp. NBC_00299]